MTTRAAYHVRNAVLPVLAGVASFLFALAALLYLTTVDQKIVASIGLGVLALLVCWVAAERPNTETARGIAALVDRLLGVGTGDFVSPAPALVHRTMPAVGRAVDQLFAEVRASIEAVRAIALYDSVTALPNRVHFKAEAEALLGDLAPGTVAALMFVDLDRFKAVNDNLGHARGDEALKMVADRLRAVAAAETHGGDPAPLVARLAGDEFTLFFPRLRDTVEALRIAEGALRALSQPFRIRGQNCDIGASIGVAICPGDGCDLPTLMRASDVAMYQAKSTGRGRVCLFNEALARRYEDRAETAEDLREAVARDELELYFQPQLSPVTGELVAVEALLRWHHPRDGLRLPETFLPVAEESGLIVDLGDWVVDAVGRTLARWRAAGIEARLALNVSARQLDSSRFFDGLRGAMARSGADLDQLELEFTESATMAFDAAVLAEIAALRADGVLVALDDFGTGLSNLTLLKAMPLDRIKIDRSLICDIDLNEQARVLAQAVVQLVHGIGCTAVAEGVERDAQADLLRLIGCDTVQGFALAEPMPGPALMSWLAARQLAAERYAKGSMAAIKAA